MATNLTPDPICRMPQVTKLTGLSKATIYRRIADNTFPKPVRLGERAVGWKSSRIADWISNLQTGATSGATATE